MLSGDRRGPSTRRGMTVLGKIPAVPKPINLPSQRLENRGLDPNVEIVPRGSLSWGSAGRSPTTDSGPWVNAGLPSSLSVSTGAWSGVTKSATVSGSNSSVGCLPGNPSRPSSTGSGTRPSSAGSIRQSHERSMNANAWGTPLSGPSSASGILEKDESQPIVARPHSAEARPSTLQSSNLSRFADSSNKSAAGSTQLQGSSGSTSKLQMDRLQPASFTLAPVDFPRLGSEKNPDLRPHQANALSGNTVSASQMERWSPPASENMPPTPLGSYGVPAKGIADTCRRDNHSFPGPLPQDGYWDQNGSHIQGYNGIPHLPESWCGEIKHGAPLIASHVEDTWRRGVTPLGPGPGRFLHDPFMHQRFGPRPLIYGKGPPGRGDFGHCGDFYGNSVPFMRQAGPGPGPGQQGFPLDQGMHPGPFQYEGYYDLPGDSSYGNMDENEMVLRTVSPAMHGSFSHQPRPPHDHDHFDRRGPRHRPMRSGGTSSRLDFKEQNGDLYSGMSHKELEKQNESWGTKEVGRSEDISLSVAVHDATQGVSGILVLSDDSASAVQKHNNNGIPDGHHECGAVASNGDEPIDFSNPVFENEISSSSPSLQCLDVSNGLTEGTAVSQKIFQCESPSHKSAEFSVARTESKHTEVNVESEGKASLQLFRSGMSKKYYIPNEEVRSEGEAGKKQDSQKDVPICSWKEADIKDKKTTDNFPNGVVGKSSCGLINSQVDNREAVSLVKGQFCDKEVHSSDREEGPITANSLPKAYRQTISAMSGGKPGSQISDLGVQKDSNLVEHTAEHNPHSFSSGSGAVEQAHKDSSKGSSAVQESFRKEDHKQKHRFNSHECEKEWRPKVSTAQLRTDATKFNTMLQVQPCKASSASAVTAIVEMKNSVEKGGEELETIQQLDNAQQFDSYDYEAQRARLKEIAAQRTIQLQKEEEERTREQRAKALAKLDELNRRTSLMLNNGEASLAKESIKVSVKECALENNSESGLQKQSGLVDTMNTARRMEGILCSEKNDYREPMQDCKHISASRENLQLKGGIGEQKEVSECKVGSYFNAPGTDPLLISSPRQLPVSHTSHPPSSIHQPWDQQLLCLTSHQGCQQNKKLVSQSKRKSNMLDDEDILDNVEATETLTEAIKTGHQKASNANTSSTVEIASNTVLGSGNNDGNPNFRRKSNRSWRNKHRSSGSAVITDPEQATALSDSSSGDPSKDGKKVKNMTEETPVSKSALVDIAANLGTAPTIALKSDFPASDVGKKIPLGGVQATIDIDAGASRPTDDIPNRREKHKPQLVRHPFRECVLQDARSDKTASSEGMIWARVRTHSNLGELGPESSNRTEGIEECHQETRHRSEEVTAQNSHGKRADLERYIPKSASKSQVRQIHFQHELPPRLHDNSFEEASGSLVEVTITHVDQLQTESVVTGSKLGNAKKTNGISRSGQLHTSWRQRNAGGISGTKEGDSSGTKEALLNEVTRREGYRPSMSSQTETEQKQMDLQTVVSGSEQRPRVSGSHSRLASVWQTKHELRSNQEMGKQFSQVHSSQDDYSKNEIHIVKESASSSQLERTRYPESVKQNTQYDHCDDEYQCKIHEVSFQHSETGKHDSRIIGYERDGRNSQERENFHQLHSTGFHNPIHQGVLDGKEHFSSASLQSPHIAPSTGQSRTNQTVANNEHEQTGKVQQLSTKLPKFQLEAQQSSIKEQKVLEKSRKVQNFSVSRQQTKSHMLSGDGSDAVQIMPAIQEQHRNGQWNRLQGISTSEREQLNDKGDIALPLQRSQGSGHFKWQQTVSGNLQAAQIVSEQSSGPERSKLDASSGEIHKQTQLQYQVVAHSGQTSQQHACRPATRPELTYSYEQQNKHRMGDHRDGFNARSKHHAPSRRGCFNGLVSGGRGVDMEKREERSKQRLVVDASVDPASSQVMG